MWSLHLRRSIQEVAAAAAGWGLEVSEHPLPVTARGPSPVTQRRRESGVLAAEAAPDGLNLRPGTPTVPGVEAGFCESLYCLDEAGRGPYGEPVSAFRALI